LLAISLFGPKNKHISYVASRVSEKLFNW